jgi:hypothetical protein
MNRPESAAAWRLFEFNWIPLGLVAAVGLACLVLSGFSVGFPGLVLCFGFVALYLGFAYYNVKAPHRRDPQVVFVLGSTGQIVLVTVLLTPLTYVAAAAGFPLQDANLLAIDRALGWDGRAYLAFINDHPLLADWLSYGYTMIRWPIFAIPVVLAAAHRYERVQNFTLALTLTLGVTTIVSAFVPALGIYSQPGVGAAEYPNLAPIAYFDSFRELPLVRDGSLRELDLFALKGLVTFPSFHAASAALYTWALWPVRWIRPFTLIANLGMLASCPVDGAHYMIDLVAGIAVTVAAIAVARWVGRWVLGGRRLAAGQSNLADAAVDGTPAE